MISKNFKKKTLFILSLLVCLLPLAGCLTNENKPLTGLLSKEPINTEIFIEELWNRGYTIESNYFSGYWTTGVYASNPENINFELYKFDSADTAISRFNSERIHLEMKHSGKSAQTEVNGFNYNKYIFNDYSNYNYLVRVDDYFLYAYGKSEYKKTIKNIMKALGY